MLYPASEHGLKTFLELVEILPGAEKAKPHILLLAGAATPYRNDTDREQHFRQESNFYYLSGCVVPSSFLLVAYRAGASCADAPTIELFIPKAEPADILWSTPPPSLEEAAKSHDVTRVDYTATLSSAIERVMKEFPDALFHTLPRGSPLFPILPEEFPQLILSSGAVTDGYLLSALHCARLIKTEYEVMAIRHANEISSRAHEVVMRVLGKAVKGEIVKGAGAGVERPILPAEWLIEKESEAEAIFVASCRREGSVHQAYLPIVAASTRASTLHYCCNDREFAWGPVRPHVYNNNHEFMFGKEHELHPQVLLIDAGCEWNCYASDITRTIPVGNGGKFTAETKAIYELVLEMQKLSMDILRPGLHWDTVQLLCHRTLVQGFQRLGIFKSPSSPGSGSWNSEEAILVSGVSTAFFPHGVGHSLGMDVHDVPSASKPKDNDTITKDPLGHDDFYLYLRLRLPLKQGMVVTVEPGIYFSPHLLESIRNSKHINHDVLKRYESIGGVRIEDVVLITGEGYENLTSIKSETAWIEKVCSGEI